VWLGHDVSVVWFIDPLERCAIELGPDANPALLNEGDARSGAPALISRFLHVSPLRDPCALPQA
jgi:hypothetical protein